MKQVIEIEHKIQAHTPLDALNIALLYDIDSQTQASEDFHKRIKELRSQRNPAEDMPIVFDCESSQIAHNPSEIRGDTKVYVGPVCKVDENGEILPEFRDIFQKLANVEHIYTSFPEGNIRRSSIEIGGIDNKAPDYLLEAALEQTGVNVDSYVRDNMMRSPDFTTFPTAQMLPIIRLKMQDLGLYENSTFDQVYRIAQELGLYLCPAEVGPRYRLKYLDQPWGEWLRIGMKPIADSDGDLNVFDLRRDETENGLCLSEGWAASDIKWGSEVDLVFSLSKKV